MRNQVKARRRGAKVKRARGWVEEKKRERWKGKKEERKGRCSKVTNFGEWAKRKAKEENGGCSCFEGTERENDFDDETLEEQYFASTVFDGRNWAKSRIDKSTGN